MLKLRTPKAVSQLAMYTAVCRTMDSLVQLLKQVPWILLTLYSFKGFRLPLHPASLPSVRSLSHIHHMNVISDRYVITSSDTFTSWLV
jgi:hypothetical protein